ncbi:MAG: hypothetical protein V4513_01500 [Pseudomonadota bacterium]
MSVLAETLNVSEAARRAGIAPVTAYRRRQTDAAFRAGWLEAVGEAYRRLELVLLERAFNGTEKTVRRRDGSEETMRHYSDELAFKLLKMHRDTALESEAEAETPADEMTEIRERLIRKLQRLKRRDDEAQAEPRQLRDCRVDEAAESSVAGNPAQGD